MEGMEAPMRNAYVKFCELNDKMSDSILNSIKYFYLPECDSTLMITRNNMTLDIDLSKKLSEETINKMIEMSNVSHFGNRNVRELDLNVRDSVEIPAKYLDLNMHLGLFDPIVSNRIVKLYKLVIYKQNGFFDWHLDTSRKNVFGTIVLNLISNYTGGALEFKDMKDNKLELFHGNDQIATEVTGAYFPIDIPHRSIKVNIARIINEIDFGQLKSVWLDLPYVVMDMVKERCKFLQIPICEAITIAEPTGGLKAYNYADYIAYIESLGDEEADEFDPNENLPIKFCLIKLHMRHTRKESELYRCMYSTNANSPCMEMYSDTVECCYYKGYLINAEWNDYVHSPSDSE